MLEEGVEEKKHQRTGLTSPNLKATLFCTSVAGR
jgi:hypothetical protein